MLTNNMKLYTTPNDGNAAAGAGRGDGKDNDDDEDTPLVCPKPDDEPQQMCKMAFSNVSVYVLISGWSSMIPLRFFNLSPSTKLANFFLMDSEDINPKAKVLYESSDRISLRQLQGLVGVHRTTCQPVYVQVVAKRKPDVMPNTATGNKILILPILVVADDSGYCVLSSFNEGLEVIYNNVDVGDYLLIPSCEPKAAYKAYHRGLFSDDMYLDLEIKLKFLTVRSCFLKKFNIQKVSNFKIPERLFGSGCNLKTPSEIYEELAVSQSVDSQQKYFDVVGVVNYVGRMQRFKTAEPMVVEDDRFVCRHVQRYLLYRWITIVDKTSKAIPIKLYVYKPTFDCQRSLVPGAMVVIAHCIYFEDSTTGRKYVASTDFTEINVGPCFFDYLSIRPKSFIDKAAGIMSRADYVEIMSRKDIAWAVGGTITLKAESEARLLVALRTNEGFKRNTIFMRTHPLKRRESRFVTVVGTIYKITHYFGEDSFRVVYTHPRFQEDVRGLPIESRISTYYFSFTSRNVHWFTFIRKLPPVDEKILEEAKSAEMTKKVVVVNEKYCKPLLMPSEMESDPRMYPPSADLEMVDGPPLLYIDVFDDVNKTVYRCMWKSTDYSCDEMLEKAKKAQEKQVACYLEVFCIEEGFPLEVNLMDFAVVPS